MACIIKSCIYIWCIFQEHTILKDERLLANEFQQFEREEREHFSILSSALKDSHEKERLQAEKTKYWSIIGSILGTVIGIFGSSINNEFRMRELRRLLSEAVTHQEKVDPIVANQLQQILLKLHDPPSPRLFVDSDQKEAASQHEETMMNLVHQQQQYQQNIALGLAALAASVILIFFKTFAPS